MVSSTDSTQLRLVFWSACLEMVTLVSLSHAPQELRAILHANTPGPLQLAALLQPFVYLLAVDPAQHAEEFANSAVTIGAEGRPMPDLALYATEVDRLQTAIADITAVCTDDVHTGARDTHYCRVHTSVL
jgi:hypothetical protein